MSHPRTTRIRKNYPSKLETEENRVIDERANGVCKVCLWKCESELRFGEACVWLNINYNNLMKQAGDIATVTSWYSFNLKLLKITGVYLSLPTQAGWFPRRGGEPEHICTRPVRDLHHHALHFYSTILSHIANCCGRYKPIWTVSCNSHNISHPSCCKLAQVVALSSPPFNVKLSVQLPSSCNAAPLMAKATTQLKEMACGQSIRRNHTSCCYCVSRTSLLNEQGMRQTVHSVQYWKFLPILFASVTAEEIMPYLRSYKVELVNQ